MFSVNTPCTFLLLLGKFQNTEDRSTARRHDLFRDSSDVWRMPCAMRLDSLRAVWALNDAFLSNKSVADEASDFHLSSVAFWESLYQNGI